MSGSLMKKLRLNSKSNQEIELKKQLSRILKILMSPKESITKDDIRKEASIVIKPNYKLQM